MKRFVFPLLSVLIPALANAAVSTNEFNAARDAYRAKDIPRLERLVEKMQGDELEIYSRYWLINVQIDTIPETQVKQFLQMYSGSLLADRLRADWLKQLGKVERWDTFSAEWPALINSDTELNCYQYRARHVLKDMTALQAARPLWFTGKDQPDACGPLFDLLRSNGLVTQDNIWDRLRLAQEENNLGLMKHLAALLPDEQSFTARQLDLVAANPQAALRKDQITYRTRGGRELALYALMRVGRTDLDQGAALLQDLKDRFNVADTTYAWGQLALSAARRHRPEALEWFRLAGNTPLSPIQLEWKARAALRAGDWQTALASIDGMGNNQQADATWRYWRARSLKALGRTIEANELFAPLSREHHFYGLLAKEEIGNVMDVAAGRYRPSDNEVNGMRRLASLSRALTLYRLDQRGDAVKEWNWGVRGMEDTQLIAAAELAARNQWYDRAIYTSDRTKDVHDFSLRYIAPYREVVQDAAKQIELDEAWVFGLMRQESRFVTVARSNVGASGLMQLMPSTAQWVAKRLGYKKFRAEMVNEIGTNVQLGTYYLKHVLDTLGGQPVLATAAYNAGPGRAKTWQASRPLEAAVYIENIPFSETRDYVKKVMANAYWYSKSFNQPAMSLYQRIGTVPGN
ncbi:soluble lytic murein transglycosylase [Chitinivorax tropicus]|uniref:Soluble lytic murein transglycosylase n=1 Tax=Chitinivorax tropicus TaxID=714531 RepID=A0A840MQE4_9PROT|nr:lytic transglycosylase domain-containing protein [Chitinivorax tropicus]MBB5017471.1 soluble lytic murein transglycosylase [Chitinivorax tropicus]